MSKVIFNIFKLFTPGEILLNYLLIRNAFTDKIQCFGALWFTDSISY